MTENNNLPLGWVWKKVSQIGDVFSGQTPKGINELSGDGNIPFYKVADMNKEGNELFLIESNITLTVSDIRKLRIKVREPGTVVFPKRGGAIATNKKRILSQPSAFDLNIMGVKPKLTLTKFFFYWLMSIDLAKLSDGSNVPQINHKDILPLEFPLPPLPEQKRIVAKIEELFTQLDAGVAELQQSRSQLHRYRQAVLKAAVEGELTSEWRETHKHELEPAEKLLASILSERRAKWEAEGCKGIFKVPTPPDSDGLRELPVGWIWACINQLSYNIQYGYTESAKEDPIGPKFLRITDIQDGKVDWDSVPYCRISDEKYIKYQLHSGDIVFTRTGATTGKSFLITSPPKAVFASYLIRLQLLSQINPKYIAQFFSSQSYWSQIMRVRKGSAQPGVNASILATLTVPLPPTNEQQRISEMVERRLSVADEIEKEIDQALARSERLRQSILKRAFEGKLVAQRLEDGDAMELVEGIVKKRTLAL